MAQLPISNKVAMILVKKLDVINGCLPMVSATVVNANLFLFRYSPRDFGCGETAVNRLREGFGNRRPLASHNPVAS